MTRRTDRPVGGTYRIRRGDEVWHHCRNCPDWPHSDYIEVDNLPLTALLCIACKAKMAAGTCH